MAKVTYQGETVEIDLASLPLHEGIAIQRKTGFRALDLDAALKAGDFVAMAALAWLILHFRMGKDITWEDIETGTVPVNWTDFTFKTPDPVDPTPAAEAATTSS